MFGCFKTLSVRISLLICKFSESKLCKNSNPSLSHSKKKKMIQNAKTWKGTLRRLVRDLSMILTANDWPETISVASLTFAEFPSPSVLPSSYFPTRIPSVTIQSSKHTAKILWNDWREKKIRSGSWVMEKTTRDFLLLPSSLCLGKECISE